MNEIAQFEVSCHYREDGLYCSGGNLYAFEPGNQMAAPAIVDGNPVPCPRCKGLGTILTPAGEQLVGMLWRHLEAKISRLVEDALENS